MLKHFTGMISFKPPNTLQYRYCCHPTYKKEMGDRERQMILPKSYTGRSRFIALRFILFHRDCVFHKSKLRPSTSKKNYDLLKAQMMVSVF